MEVMNTIRHEEKEITLSNQQIIELGYFVKDLFGPVVDEKAMLIIDQINCYTNVFYLVKDLLKQVDPEYLEMHQRVRDFYDRELSDDWDNIAFSFPPFRRFKKEDQKKEKDSETCPICGGEAGH
ncbi:MAG: hypothetical protein ISS63_00655 [Desulfobacteraceae bacterium]|nr:hypothetical protein [Desulfobacteraceae bacterium]